MDGNMAGAKKRRKVLKKSQPAKFRRKDSSSLSDSNDTSKETIGTEQIEHEEGREDVRRRELDLLSREALIERIIRLEDIRDEISKLPDELLLHIFSFLPRKTLGTTARVCKRWRGVSYDSKFWGSVNYMNKDVVNSGELGEVLARGCLHLGLHDCKYKRPVFTMRMTETSYKLEELCMTGAEMSMHEFHMLLSRCEHLEHLFSDDAQLDDEICRKIARNPEFHVINLSLSEGEFTHEGLLAIARGCQKLVKLFIHTHDQVHYTSHNDLLVLVKELPSSLEFISVFRYNFNFSDEHVRNLVSKLPNLKELELEGCKQLTGKAVKYISRLSKLTYLDLSRCTGIPPAALKYVGKLKKLRRLPLLGELLIFGLVNTDQGTSLQAVMPRVYLDYEGARSVFDPVDPIDEIA